MENKVSGGCPWGPKTSVQSTAAAAQNPSEAAPEKAGGGAATAHGGRHGPRPSRRNKKVYKVIDLASFTAEPPQNQPNITTPDVRFQTNGVPPISIRKPEYAPAGGHGHNVHQTFSNMFENLSKPRPKNFERSQFAMKDEEFPTLGK